MQIIRIVHIYKDQSCLILPYQLTVVSICQYTQRKMQCFNSLTLVSICEENFVADTVTICNDRRIYSRETMPISVNKCSFIYAAQDKVNRLVSNQQVSFWELVQPLWRPTLQLARLADLINCKLIIKTNPRYGKLVVPMHGSNYQCKAAITQ